MEVRFKKTPECKQCGEEEPDKFPIRNVDGKRYYRHLCRKCFNLYTSGRRHGVGGMTAGVYARRQAKVKLERKQGSAREVIHDCRGWDRKHGFECDLDREFVETLIAQGCSYCGVGGRIGLDRIDNAMGHIKLNVVPACTPCNLVRGNMPYLAWLVVAKGMKEARQLGLLDGWLPGRKAVQGVG